LARTTLLKAAQPEFVLLQPIVSRTRRRDDLGAGIATLQQIDSALALLVLLRPHLKIVGWAELGRRHWGAFTVSVPDSASYLLFPFVLVLSFGFDRANSSFSDVVFQRKVGFGRPRNSHISFLTIRTGYCHEPRLLEWTVFATGGSGTFGAFCGQLPASRLPSLYIHTPNSKVSRVTLQSNTSLAIVIGDYVYIDGGEIWQYFNGSLTHLPSKSPRQVSTPA